MTTNRPLFTRLEALFHATLPDVEELILDEGLLLNHQKVVNLSGLPEHAAGYVNLLGCVRLEGVRPTSDEPHFVQTFFTSITVFDIDPECLAVDELETNEYDHHQSTYGVLPSVCSSYVYRHHIPPYSIRGISRFELNDYRIPVEFRSPRRHG